MNVKELIKGLINTEDMMSPAYVRIVDRNGNATFIEVDGIAIDNDSHLDPGASTACTTLALIRGNPGPFYKDAW